MVNNSPSLAILNGIWNALANAAGFMAGIIGSIIIVRNLSIEEYGQLSYFIWLFGLLAALCSLGFPVTLTKINSELAGQQEFDERRKLTFLIFIILLLFATLTSLLVLIWGIFYAEEIFPYFVVIAILILPNSLLAMMRSTLWSSEKYKPVSFFITLGSAFQLILIILVSSSKPTTFNFFLALSIPLLIQFFGLGVYLLTKHSIRELRNQIGFPTRRTLLMYFSFLLPTIILQLYLLVVWQRSEVFFLKRFSTISEVGFYSLAFTIFAIFIELGWALVNGYFPAISRNFGAGDWKVIEHHFQEGIRIAALYALPISLGGILIMERVILLLYGEKMIPAVPVARILYIGILPGVLSGMLGLVLSAVGGIWIYAGIGVGMLLLNIVLDIILIPIWGAVGGATANTSIQVCLVLILAFTLRKTYRLDLPWIQLGKLLLIGLFSIVIAPGLVFIAIDNPWAQLLATVLIAGLAYSILLWRFGELKGTILKTQLSQIARKLKLVENL